ncbi:DUF4157 domain-containing protein [Pseudenhygromyxa sp. WMMC2535]|uniref:eCIS core domain-containing protein n=1 Tax=Pseudenhygromyxa sp. WMMC2535 TaxID=2712867 RepID=UPI0015544673|nr:DUF4157 domain-containing protein [Pseudenhygromyxa sp. WMMC2535]NVB37590.1 DUF4157 domain-containing protein [Pseudenhygromyxa sp. WMMC2535]
MFAKLQKPPSKVRGSATKRSPRQYEALHAEVSKGVSRDLGSVEFAHGPEVDRANDALSSDAFSLGDSVYLSSSVVRGDGQIRPGMERTVAHEIVHTT